MGYPILDITVAKMVQAVKHVIHMRCIALTESQKCNDVTFFQTPKFHESKDKLDWSTQSLLFHCAPFDFLALDDS